MSVTLTVREVKAAAVAELYATGMNGIQIAKALGLSRSYSYELLTDPDGIEVRKRKAKQGGTCLDCGAATSYGQGYGPNKRCLACHTQYVRKWTPEAVVAAMQRYNEVTGHPPTATNWNTAHPNHRGDIARIFHEGNYPATNTVQAICGSWNAGLVLAGFLARQPWGHRGLSEVAYERTATMYLAGTRIAEIARREGVTHNAIATRLKKLGIYNPTPQRKDIMAASLKAEQVIDREIERAEHRLERLREELADTENTVARLKAARVTLTEPLKAVA